MRTYHDVCKGLVGNFQLSQTIFPNLCAVAFCWKFAILAALGDQHPPVSCAHGFNEQQANKEIIRVFSTNPWTQGILVRPFPQKGKHMDHMYLPKSTDIE